MTNPAPNLTCPVSVRGLTMKYGDTLIQQNLNFDVQAGSTMIVMGGSGCGKSTLLRHLIGIKEPAEGTVYRSGIDFWHCSQQEQEQIMRNSGILYQSGALWSSMTIAENVALPLKQFTKYNSAQIKEIVDYKLSLVGLAGFGELYPSEISGGMKKRAGLARAMVMDPQLLFFDEPSAGLDPLSARRLDELIIELRESLGATFVVITHDLDSIFMIGTDSIFLDAVTKTLLAHGNPHDLREHAESEMVRNFLRRK